MPGYNTVNPPGGGGGEAFELRGLSGPIGLDVPAAVLRTPGIRSTDQVVAGGPFGVH